MNSEFVRQVHQATCQRLADAGCSEQQIREHLRSVWVAEADIDSYMMSIQPVRAQQSPNIASAVLSS